MSISSINTAALTFRRGRVANEDIQALSPCWTYNPSSWRQRIPIVVLAAIGFVIAGYLALYQIRDRLPWITRVWDPFFGNGSEIILNSWVSTLLPISDATLGALGYFADAVTGAIGGQKRWKTMPWLVVLFGVFVGPLGIISVLLVILQPVLFDSWCTFCLVTAGISILMIGPAMDEVLASLQFLKRERAAGRPLWDAFWYGSRDHNAELATDASENAFDPALVESFEEERRGSIAVTWTALASVLSMIVGIGLTALPHAMGFAGALQLSDHIVGPIIASFACIAICQTTQAMRWLNVPLGLWVILSPFLFASDGVLLIHVAIGLAIVVFSMITGPERHHLGGGWTSLWRSREPKPALA